MRTKCDDIVIDVNLGWGGQRKCAINAYAEHLPLRSSRKSNRANQSLSLLYKYLLFIEVNKTGSNKMGSNRLITYESRVWNFLNENKIDRTPYMRTRRNVCAHFYKSK